MLRAMRPRTLKVVDLVTLLVLSGFILLVVATRHRLPGWHGPLLRYGVLVLLQVGVIVGRGRGLPAVLTAFFPLIPILAIYDSLSFIPQLHPGDKDLPLLAMDRALLGVDLSLWLETYTRPWLTELMQVSYLVYYLVPFLVLGALFRRRPAETGQPGPDFDLCVTAMALSHYLAFVWYLTVPALGPRFALASQYHVELTGLWLATPIHDALNFLEGIKRDAFPSDHTSVALVSLYYAVRFTPRLVPFIAPGVFLMILSTMYLRYHYLVDVLAGALLAACCILLSRLLCRLPLPGATPSA
jgi:membrane-associated phospholipid phosphatase